MMRIWVRGEFLAWIDGREAVLASGEPFLDMARVLLAEGVDPGESIEMWHEGAETWALRSTVGAAARLEVGGRTPRLRLKGVPAGP